MSPRASSGGLTTAAADLRYVKLSEPISGNEATRTVTANYAVVVGDRNIFVVTSVAPITITLPTATGNAGRRIGIIHAGAVSHGVVIDGYAQELISGEQTLSLPIQWGTVELLCSGVFWAIVG